MKASKTTSWRTLMKEQRELRKKGAALLYQRVKLLVAIFDDDLFLADCDRRAVDPMSELTAELEGDTMCKFPVARKMLEAFPDEDQWVGRKLNEMAAEVLDGRRKKEVTGKGTPWKTMYHDMLAQNEELKRQIEVLQARLDELRGGRNAA